MGDLDALCRRHPGFPSDTPLSKGMHVLTQGDDGTLGGCYWIEKERVNIEDLVLQPEGGLVPIKPWSLVIPHPASKAHIGVPKFYGMSMFGTPRKDLRVPGMPCTYAFTPTLRPEQELGVSKTLDTLRAWGGAFFVADCGFGKTVCMAALIARLGVSAMVVVPRITLIEQCMQTLPAMMPGIDIGVLQGAVATRHMVMVASLDSLAQIAYPQSLLDSFGLVVFDEAHHMAASTLSKILPRICARNIVGFSATPDRRDGLEHALYWLLGPTSFVYQRLPSITGISHTVEICKTASPTHVPEIMLYNGTLNFSGMITSLNNEPRNVFLVGLATRAVEEGRKKVLMITALHEHVDALHALLTIPHEAVHGGMNTKARARVAIATSVLVATYGMLEEGFDDPAIDTLILCTPRSRVQQTIGRAERTAVGKLRPRVYDVVDDNHVFQAMWRKRCDFYETRGFLIQGVERPSIEFEGVEYT